MWYTLDQIIRSLLLKEHKSIHYYLQYLSYACSGLQRLNNTTLRNVNSVKLPVSSYKSITLPCDYVDYVRVGVAVGERVKPLVLDTSLNRLNNYDGAGQKIPYEISLTTEDNLLTTETAEDTPFGHDASRDSYCFNVFRERGEIQLSADYPFDFVVLSYITDGLTADASTMVDPLAHAAIEKWILWQALVHKRHASEGERMAAEKRFNDEWRLLRAAKSELTKENIIHAIQSGYSATYR